jgi:site-specific recombinase XerD
VSEWTTTATLTSANIATYVKRRLRDAQRKSVLNEASALRSFCKWMHESNTVAELLTVPTVPKAIGGTKYRHRHRVRAPNSARKR